MTSGPNDDAGDPEVRRILHAVNERIAQAIDRAARSPSTPTPEIVATTSQEIDELLREFPDDMKATVYAGLHRAVLRRYIGLMRALHAHATN